MFLRCLPMPVPGHVPVLRCCAAVVLCKTVLPPYLNFGAYAVRLKIPAALGKPCCCRHILLWLAVLLAWLCHAPVLYGHAVRFELQCNTCLKEVRVVSLQCLCRVLPVSLPYRAVARPCWCRVLVMSLP